jgi:hypothetical protein
MKNNFSKYLVLGVATVNLLVVPVTVLAQDNLSQPNLQQNQPQPIDNNSSGTTTDDSGFNPWWLLPLALIPLAFMLFRKDNAKEDSKRGARGEYEQMAYHDIDKNKKEKKGQDKKED